MSWAASKWAIQQQVGSAAGKAVLLVLAEAANQKTHSCYPSQKTIATRAEISERSVWGAMNELAEAGLITRRRRPGKGGHRASDMITLAVGQVARCAGRAGDQLASSAGRTGATQLATGERPTRKSSASQPAPVAGEPVSLEPGSKNEGVPPSTLDDAFRRLVAAFPERTASPLAPSALERDRRRALPILEAAIAAGDSADSIVSGAETYGHSSKVGRGYAENLSTWLARKGWRDGPEEERQQPAPRAGARARGRLGGGFLDYAMARASERGET